MPFADCSILQKLAYVEKSTMNAVMKGNAKPDAPEQKHTRQI